MDFLDRHAELDRLRHALRRERACLIVVYGRRRCGKSTLLRQVLDHTRDVYFLASESDPAVQRRELAEAVGWVIPGFADVDYPSWSVLFRQLLARLPRGCCCAIDEFPYLLKGDPALASVVQRAVDDRTAVLPHLVLCGSSQQMMRGTFVDATAPLYGRADEIIELEPLAAGYLGEALGVSGRAAVEEHAVWGGVPRYWELRERYPDLDAAIRALALDRNGVLHEEPTRLLLDDMRSTVQPVSILKVIADGAHRSSEIAGRLGKPATSLSQALSRLVALGYVARDLPFGESTRSSKRTLYRIADPFLRFYFRYVTPARSTLELGLVEPVYERIVADRSRYTGEHWGELCRRAVPFLAFGDVRFGPAQRWWGPGMDREPMELDIVARSLDGSTLLLGECKWGARTPTARLLTELRRKAERLPLAGNYERVELRIFASSASNEAIGPEEVLTALR